LAKRPAFAEYPLCTELPKIAAAAILDRRAQADEGLSGRKTICARNGALLVHADPEKFDASLHVND